MELPADLHSKIIYYLDRSHASEIVCRDWAGKTRDLAPKSYAAIRARNWVGMKSSKYTYPDAIKLMFRNGFGEIAPKDDSLTRCPDIVRGMFATPLIGNVKDIFDRIAIKYDANVCTYGDLLDLAVLAREYGNIKIMNGESRVPFTKHPGGFDPYDNSRIIDRVIKLQDVELAKKLIEIDRARPPMGTAARFNADKIIPLCDERGNLRMAYIYIYARRDDKLQDILLSIPHNAENNQLLMRCALRYGNMSAFNIISGGEGLTLEEAFTIPEMIGDMSLILADAELIQRYVEYFGVNKTITYFKTSRNIIVPSNPAVDFMAEHCPSVLEGVLLTRGCRAKMRYQLEKLEKCGVKRIRVDRDSYRWWCRMVCDIMPSMRPQIREMYHAKGIGEMVEYIDRLNKKK